MPQPILVAIAGGSGSGKTWLANRLATALGGRVSRISLDDFYRDLSHLPPRARERVNFDHPRAIDWSGLESALQACRAGRGTALPRYDYKTHCRRPRLKCLRPAPVVICDGLWLLRRRALRRCFHLRIFVDCPAALRLRRRLERDTRERGRRPESVVRQFQDRVAPMHRQYVAPQAARADFLLRSPVANVRLRQLIRVLRRLRERATYAS